MGTAPADIGQVEKIGDVVIGNAAPNFSPGSTGDGAWFVSGKQAKASCALDIELEEGGVCLHGQGHGNDGCDEDFRGAVFCGFTVVCWFASFHR